MNKALKVIGIGCGGCLVLVVAALAIGYSLLPSDYTVERSITIDAPDAIVFPLVDTPKRWPEWDPWHEIDPDMEHEYKGPPAGVGAESHWTSTEAMVGEGWFRIDESVPGERIVMTVDSGGMVSQGIFEFAEASGDATRVTWRSEGELEGMNRFFGPFADALLGANFEVGLANLKELAEEEYDTPLGRAKGAVDGVLDAADDIQDAAEALGGGGSEEE